MNHEIWTLEQAEMYHRFSPKLAQAIRDFLFHETQTLFIVDYGCGFGEYLKHLDNSFRCYGIEGTKGISDHPNAYSSIIEADLSQNFGYSLFKDKTLSVISLEVAEHIYPDKESVFIDNITRYCSEYLILSWALEGQGGVGHHNERNAEYVIPTIEARGFTFLPEPTQVLRDAGGSELSWFQNSIYVFKKK